MANTRQKRSWSSDLRVGHLIGLLERVMIKQIAEVLSPLEMTFQQFIALTILASRGAISNADLARISQMTPQSANQTVKSLESRRWISRQENPEHQRIVLLSITPRGESALEAADTAVMMVEQRMLNGLPLCDRKKFHQQLKSCLIGLGESESSVRNY